MHKSHKTAVETIISGLAKQESYGKVKIDMSKEALSRLVMDFINGFLMIMLHVRIKGHCILNPSEGKLFTSIMIDSINGGSSAFET